MSSIGEKAFLRWLVPSLPCDPRIVDGLGHDAALIDGGLEAHLVLKIDRVPTSISAERGWSDDAPRGRLAVTAACSDVLAIGSHPEAMMISVSVPGDWDADRVRAIIEGCADECDARGIAFAGGDLKESATPHIVAAALGLAHPDFHLRRDTATAGDLLVVTGALGGFVGSYLQLVDSADEHVDVLSGSDTSPILRPHGARLG
jgi:thiamine-monophosphate kinase